MDVEALPLAYRALQSYVRQMGDKFINRLAIRGYDLVSGLRLHGPWPSYGFNEHLSDVKTSLWKQADRENDLSPLLGEVFNQEGRAFSPYVDYLLVGAFLKQAVLTEIWIPEENNGLSDD